MGYAIYLSVEEITVKEFIFNIKFLKNKQSNIECFPGVVAAERELEVSRRYNN